MKTRNHFTFQCLLILFLSCCFFVCGEFSAKAQQTVLLKPINLSQLPLLPTEKQSFWDRLNALNYKKSLSLVKVGDLPNLQQNGFLTFTIPGVAATINAHAVRVEYEAAKQYIWQGKIDQAGYMSIVSTNDGVSGFIQLNNKHFVLFPLYKSYCALFEYDMNAMPADSCSTTSTPILVSQSSSIDYCAEDDNCTSTIDVLVLITPEARNWIGGTFGDNWLNALAYVINGAETVNLAFDNSDINANIRTRYAALNDFPYSSSPIDHQVDVTNLTNLTAAISLRNQYRADLVIMLTDDRYGTVAGTVAEIGPNAQKAYGIVTMGNLLNPRFSYAHEVGHLFGARHNTDTGGDCEHGFIFDDTNDIQRRTLLAGLPATAGSRIVNYSNPDINFNGAATGAEDNNNAHMIQNTSCTVRMFRSDPTFSALIQGYAYWCVPGHLGTEAPNTYEAIIIPATPGFPGNPPYTYEWRWNTSGIFSSTSPSTLIGTTSSITLNEPLFCPFFFLHLKVTCADGTISTKTLQVNTDSCEPESCDGAGKNILSEQTNDVVFHITPNPANAHFRVLAPSAQEDMYQIQLIDVLGKIVEEHHLLGSSVGVQQNFNTTKLPTGVYYIRLIGHNTSYCQKILITH